MNKIKDSGYYNFKKTLNKYPNAHYYLIFGERSNGKSYSVLEYILQKFYDSNYQDSFAYIRRWTEDTTRALMQQVFKNLIHNDKGENIISKITKNEYDDIFVKNKKFYLCKYNNEDEEMNILKTQPLGYIFSLSVSERVKSTGYPDVKTIMFDEFISEGLPMVNEFTRLTSLFTTIIRNRDDVKIILCGNTLNKHNIYFQEFGLKNAKNQKQGTIDIYQYPSDDGRILQIISEFADFPQRNKIKKSNIYFAFNKEKNKMIRNGSWDIGYYPHLEYYYTPKDIKLIYFIKNDDEIYQCEVISLIDSKENRIINDDNYIYSNKRIMFTYIHKKTTNIKYPHQHIIYQKENSSLPNVLKNPLEANSKITTFIKSFYLNNKVFYQDNDVGDSINDFLNK